MFSIAASSTPPQAQHHIQPQQHQRFQDDEVMDIDAVPTVLKKSSSASAAPAAAAHRIGGFDMEASLSASSLDSSSSSLADLSLASTTSCSSATSVISGDDDSVLMQTRTSPHPGDSFRFVQNVLDRYSMAASVTQNQQSLQKQQHPKQASYHPYYQQDDADLQSPGSHGLNQHTSAQSHLSPSYPASTLGLDLGAHAQTYQNSQQQQQQHRHSIANGAIAALSSGSSAHTSQQSSSAAQRANSTSLPSSGGTTPYALATPQHAGPLAGLRGNGLIHVDSTAAAELQASLNRFKITLPAISIPDDAFSSRVATVPITPGGSLFFGARDGAANGVPMSPFNPPTPLVQSGALNIACEERLAAEGGILGSVYVASQAGNGGIMQLHYSPQPYVSQQNSPYSVHYSYAQQQQHGQQQQTGPHRNRVQQKRTSLPHALPPLVRSLSGPVRSPLPRPQSRGGPASSSSRSASPRNSSPSALETGMSRVSVASTSSNVSSSSGSSAGAMSSQAMYQMQARLAERYSPTRASMPTGASSVSAVSSCSSSASSSMPSSSLAVPSLLTPPYSPMNMPGMYEGSNGLVAPGLTWYSSTPRLNSPSGGQQEQAMNPTSVLHGVDVVTPSRKNSAPVSRPCSQQALRSPHIHEPQSDAVPDSMPSPASLHLQLDVPSAEEIQAIKAISASSTAMVKSASAPTSSAKTVSARYLADYKLHPTFAANYTLGDELGSGGFGFVVSALRNADSFPVAVKFIWKEKVPSQGWVRDRDLGVVPMEVFVLKTVRHPSVVRYIELFDDDQFFYLIMELHGTPWKAPPSKSSSKKSSPTPTAPASETQALMPSLQANAMGLVQAGSQNDAAASGKALRPPPPVPMERPSSCDLFECIEQHSRLSEEQARWVFAQVVEAVFYLDNLGITHRDIKDENCVVDADFNVKLIDFGSAVVSDPRAPAPYFNRFYGTMTFASAEILQGKLYRAPQAEVWSLGVLLSILLSGECPFSDPSAAIKGRISRPKGAWTSESLELMMRCIEVDPNRRANVAELREHPWVRRAWELRGLQRPT